MGIGQNWLEVRVVVGSEATDAVSEMFMDLGAAGVVIDDPRVVQARLARLGTQLIDEPDARSGDDDDPGVAEGRVGITAYLTPRTVDATVAELEREIQGLSLLGLDPGDVEISTQVVHDEDWANSWKQYYTIQRIGRRLVIVPSWIAYSPQPGEVPVALDPGMAFGTGTHPSTQLCLEVLEELVSPGASVLDVGTGSGILAIAAAKLGARVHACDIDPQAVAVAKENAKANGVAGAVRVVTGTLEQLERRSYDIVVANIIAETIVGILPRIGEFLHPGGHFIASGIIAGRMEEVRAAWRCGGLHIADERHIDDWFCVTGGPQL